MRRKLKEALAVCPNVSTTVTSRVWLSVPNLEISAITGKEQFSAAPPSNEHMTLAMGLLTPQEKVCLPATAPVAQSNTSAAGEKIQKCTHCVAKLVDTTNIDPCLSQLPGGVGGSRAAVTNINHFHMFTKTFLCLRSMRLKLNETTADLPNTSTTVTSRVWLSVPNLSIPTSIGNEQASPGPPSNEQVTLSMGEVTPQENVCLPGTAEIPHCTSRSVAIRK